MILFQMGIHQFLFGDKLVNRSTRHGLFWMVFCLYVFFFMYPRYDYTLLFDLRTYGIRFQNLLIFLLAAVPGTLFSLHYFSSSLLKKPKIVETSFMFIGLGLFFIFYTWMIVRVVNPALVPGLRLSNSSTFDRVSFIIYSCFIMPLLPIVFVITTRLIKSWYTRTQETIQVANRKKDIELELLKMKAHPLLIIKSMRQLQNCLVHNESKFPELLLGISDVLSYVIYEADATLVSLEKEIDIIKKYIDSHNDGIDPKIFRSSKFFGDFRKDQIAPLILLSILQVVLEQMERSFDPEKLFLDLEMVANSGTISLTMEIGNWLDKSLMEFKKTINASEWLNRVDTFYVNKYTLDIFQIEKDSAIRLNLKLDLSINASLFPEVRKFMLKA